MKPKTFGDYSLTKKLAAGGMGEVYLANQAQSAGFDRYVAIKRILPELSGDDEFVRMFLDEARLAAKLNHPNVVQIYDLGICGEMYYLAMEFLEGRDLRRVMGRLGTKRRALPIAHAVQIIYGAAEGLHYAHNLKDAYGKPLNIIHRDVSPQNVFVTFHGTVKVLDFGIAKAEARSVRTRTGGLKGKYPYLSPEQVRGDDVDGRSDLFSLGTVLWEVTVGRRLFKRDNDLLTLKAVVKGEIPRPSTLMKRYPPELEEIVMKSLARNPDERYSSCREIQEDLEQFVGNHGLVLSPQKLGGFVEGLFPDEPKSITDILEELKKAPKSKSLLSDDAESSESFSQASEPSSSRDEHTEPSSSAINERILDDLNELGSDGSASVSAAGPSPLQQPINLGTDSTGLADMFQESGIGGPGLGLSPSTHSQTKPATPGSAAPTPGIFDQTLDDFEDIDLGFIDGDGAGDEDSVSGTPSQSSPSVTPSRPSVTPSRPSVTPSEPGTRPSDPSVTPSNPGASTPSQPEVTPSSPLNVQAIARARTGLLGVAAVTDPDALEEGTPPNQVIARAPTAVGGVALPVFPEEEAESSRSGISGPGHAFEGAGESFASAHEESTLEDPYYPTLDGAGSKATPTGTVPPTAGGGIVQFFRDRPVMVALAVVFLLAVPVFGFLIVSLSGNGDSADPDQRQATLVPPEPPGNTVPPLDGQPATPPLPIADAGTPAIPPPPDVPDAGEQTPPDAAPSTAPDARAPTAPAQLAKATLFVSTSPDGLQVLINDEDIGNSPTEVALAPGRYRITAKTISGTEKSIHVTLEPGQFRREQIKMSRSSSSGRGSSGSGSGSGTLSLRIRPYANVFIDGRPHGLTPMPPVTLPAGRHRVRLVNDSLNRSVVRTVTIRPGQRATLSVNMSSR